MTGDDDSDLPKGFMPENADDAAPFDQALADTYLGKHVLVGLTFFNAAGDVTRQVQLHGKIESASPTGIRLFLLGKHHGQSWIMPPALDFIAPAQPGRYTLRATGEVVVDPDLLSTWEITESAH